MIAITNGWDMSTMHMNAASIGYQGCPAHDRNHFPGTNGTSFPLTNICFKSMIGLLHPGRLTWNILLEVWKIFLSKWVICRFHVNLPGCKCLIAGGSFDG